MGANIVATGQTIKWRATACFNGQMVAAMKATTLMTKRRAKGRSFGPMAASTKASGRTASSTASESTRLLQVRTRRASGRKESAPPGSERQTVTEQLSI